MKLLGRCGECPACQFVLSMPRNFFRRAPGTTLHGDDEVEVWNRTLAENPCENPVDETLRSFTASSGRRYRARRVPHEDRRAGGTDRRVAAAFETEDGE